MSGLKYARIFYAKRAENTKIKTKLVKSINRKYKQEEYHNSERGHLLRGTAVRDIGETEGKLRNRKKEYNEKMKRKSGLNQSPVFANAQIVGKF